MSKFKYTSDYIYHSSMLNISELRELCHEELVLIVNNLKFSQLEYMKKYGENKMHLADAYELLLDILLHGENSEPVKERINKIIETATS